MYGHVVSDESVTKWKQVVQLMAMLVKFQLIDKDPLMRQNGPLLASWVCW